jgi:hypothetical protein
LLALSFAEPVGIDRVSTCASSTGLTSTPVLVIDAPRLTGVLPGELPSKPGSTRSGAPLWA